LAAHYDSAAVGPGASDDGAAVAAMVEVARIVGARGGLRNDLVLLVTDGEEDGLLGADAFVREHPLAHKGGVVLNWEARGVGGPSLMFETSPGNSELVSLFTEAVPHPRGDSSMVEIYRMLPNNTDFTTLSAAGFAGLNSAYIEGASRYHTADDSIANLDRGSLQHHGENMLHLTDAFGDADLATLASGHDATYFRLFGMMITYSDALVWPLAVAAVLAVAALVGVAARRRVASVPRVLLGAVSALLPLALSVLLAQGLWILLVGLRPGYDAMGGLLHRPLAYQAALAALAGLALLGWYLLLRRRLGPAALAIGALMWPAALGVVCAAWAPGASFLFALPACFAALGGLVALLAARFAAWPVVAVTAGALISTALLPVLARNAFNGLGLALGGVATACIALFGLTLLPIVELLFPSPTHGISRRAATAVPLIAVVSVAGLVGTGLAVDRFDARNPERTHLAYVLNADTGTAAWVSAEDEPTEWTARHVHSRDVDALPPGYARGELWTGPATPITAEGPEVSVRARDGDAVTVHVASKRAASSLVLRIDHRIVEATAVAPGAAPLTVPVNGTRANTWPGEIRFRDLPPEGVDITLRAPGADRVRITAIDETFGLVDAPGLHPRPPGTVASTREDGDLIAAARTYEV
ncbi:MAG: M28 family peptidase, partial [Kibdelosporangium sp.]